MRRDGFSLLEVILAMAILFAAIAVLGELARSGTRSAGSARDLTQAQLLCESKMSEITAGLAPLEAVQPTAFESTTGGPPEWLFAVDVAPLDQEGLIQVVVIVEQNPQVARKPVHYSLVRWMLDPGMELPESAVSQ
jgi:type II secretion system protein I